MRVKNSSRVTGAICVAGVALLAVGILIARQPAENSEAAITKAPAAKRAAVETGRKAQANRPATRAQAKKPAAATTSASAAPAPLAAAEAPAARATATEGGSVTISGCLERDNTTYRLRDTEGTNAPKARSWKSGFIKKGSAKVDIIDASNRLRLQNHVGHRISVTGTLRDKEMVARSVQHLSPSCN